MGRVLIGGGEGRSSDLWKEVKLQFQASSHDIHTDELIKTRKNGFTQEIRSSCHVIVGITGFK